MPDDLTPILTELTSLTPLIGDITVEAVRISHRPGQFSTDDIADLAREARRLSYSPTYTQNQCDAAVRDVAITAIAYLIHSRRTPQ